MVLKEASYFYPIFVHFGHDGALNVTKSIITCNHQFPIIPPYKYHANVATEDFLVKCSQGGIYAKFWSQEIWQRWWNIFPSTRVLSFDQLISSLVGFDLDLDLSDLCDLTASNVVQLFCQSGLLIFLSSPWHIGPGPGSLTYWTWLQFLTLAWIDELIWPLIMLLDLIICEFWPKYWRKDKSVTRGKCCYGQCPLIPRHDSAPEALTRWCHCCFQTNFVQDIVTFFCFCAQSVFCHLTVDWLILQRRRSSLNIEISFNARCFNVRMFSLDPSFMECVKIQITNATPPPPCCCTTSQVKYNFKQACNF